MSKHRIPASRTIGMIALALLLVIFGSGKAVAEDRCQLKDLESVSASHPECLFYSGTAAFREENYSEAARFWKKLISTRSVPIEYEHLKISAYNNLGYLYFFGHGVAPDKKAAIKYWMHATKAGNEEAPFHLCHAYAEEKEPGYDPGRALGFCKEALRRYELLEERPEGTEQIVRQLKRYIRKLAQLRQTTSDDDKQP